MSSHLQAEASLGSGPRKSHTFAFVLLVFAAIALSHLVLLHLFASDLPRWDQWDGEAQVVLRPFELHELTLKLLFAPHNEHHIVITKLATLGLYALNNHQWDNLVSVVFNALFYALIYALTLRTLIRELDWRTYLPLFVLVLLSACLPIATDNMVSGFQNQFYFLVASCLIGVWFAASRQPSPQVIMVATLIALAGIFSMASGLINTVAIATAALLRWQRVPGVRQPLMLLIASMMLVGLIGVLLVPKVPFHDNLHARDIADFLNTAVMTFAWPLPAHWYCALALWAPCLIGIPYLLRRPMTRIDNAAIALAVWVALQGIAMAYGRAHAGADVVPRYFDVLWLGVLVNAYLVLRICDGLLRGRVAAVLATTALLGYATMAGSLAVAGYAFLQRYSDEMRLEASNVRNFMHTGNFAAFAASNIPYPVAETLARYLRDPTVISMLPPSIRPGLPLPHNTGFIPTGAYPSTPAPPSSLALGSFALPQGDGNVAHLRSETLSTRFPYIGFNVAGYAGTPGLTLAVVSTDGDIHSVAPPRPPGESWAQLIVPVPRQGFYVTADDTSIKSWFAFTEPVEIGRLSALTLVLLNHSMDMVLTYLALIALIVVYTWVRHAQVALDR